ncbi:MAG: RNA-binding domain-containing protein [Ilyomonas sp.]
MTIEHLVQLKESENKVEFKEARNQYSYKSGRKSVIGYVVALANEKGGYLVLGVTDTYPHSICGSKAFEGREGKLEQDVYNDLGIRIETEVLHYNTKRVLIIKVPPRPLGKPLYFEDVALMRVGDQLCRMSEDIYRSIIQEQEPDFSAKICEDLEIEDLDVNAIAKMKEAYSRKQKNGSFLSLSTNQVLKDLKLFDKKLNYAALILLGKKEVIERRLPQAKVVWEFRFTEAQINTDFREVICEPLFNSIDKIWALINDKNGSIPIRSDAYIFNISTFNEEVIREATLNAVTHRDYTLNSEVVIKQYPKKIIINNPGGFPIGVTLTNLITTSSTPRSRLMAEVLEKTGLVERSGQGVDKIFSITLAEGKPEPYYDDSDFYQITLKLEGILQDKAFHIFINKVQGSRIEGQKLGVEQIVALHKIKQGYFAQVKPSILSQLEKEGLISKLSGHTNRYTLADEYYSLNAKEQRIKSRYLVAEVVHFLLALQGNILSIGQLETDLAGSLNRNQIKYLITKLFEDEIILTEGVGRGTKYKLSTSFSKLKGDALVNEVILKLKELYD